MKRPGKWEKQAYKLPENHGWRAKPGYQIFVAGRGDVRFDIPQGWIVEPDDVSVKLYDKKPPADDCRLEMSYLRLHPGVDWSGLPLSRLFSEIIQRSGQRDELSRGEVQVVKRDGLELMWQEIRFLDPGENREACSRACLARGQNVQPFITMDYWPEHAEKFVPVWDEVLRSLTLGDYIANPLKRVLH
jgi:hypothetical protein